MTKYVCNAFSAQMLLQMARGRLSWVFIDKSLFEFLIEDAVSFMGHKDLAEEFDVDYNRKPFYLKKGDCIYISQVVTRRENKKDGKKEVVYLQIFVEEE